MGHLEARASSFSCVSDPGVIVSLSVLPRIIVLTKTYQRYCAAKGTSAGLSGRLGASGVLIAVHQSVNDKVDPDATRRRLDQLIEEAVGLREQITAALDRECRPFFPERRRAHQPHTPERRHPS